MKKTGDKYFDSKEFRDLLSEYEQATESGSPVFLDADELAEIADYYQMTGLPDKADKAINLALSLSPGAIAPLSYKIHEALYLNDIEGAKRFLDLIIEKDDPEYVYNTAEILLAEGKEEEADKYLREQFKTIPPDEYQDYVIDVANIMSDYGANDKALQWMARAKQEDSPDFKELMARTLFGIGKYKDSEKIWGELIDTDPFSKHYWNALASAQFMNEDYTNSIQSSEFAIAIDPNDAESLLSKANGLYHLGNYEEALNYYRRYSDIVPDDEFALMHQGTCLINLGRTEEAIGKLKEAEDISIAYEEENRQYSPQEASYLSDIYQELAFAYNEVGDTDAALDCLNKTDHLDCDHILSFVIKGHILLSAGRRKEAEEMFYQAMEQSNDMPETFLRIIVSFYDNKLLEAAYAMFQRFFRYVGKDSDIGYAYMALCCYDMRKYDEFLSYLKEACHRNPRECRIALSHIFPNEVEPKDYYEYIKNRMK